MSVDQDWMASDGPKTPSSPQSIQSDVDHSETPRPKTNLPPITSVGPKVPFEKVYLMGYQAAIFYEVF